MEVPDKRRIVLDPDHVLDSVAVATGQESVLVGRVVGVFREAIDSLLAEGCVVATGELFLAFGNSPTRQRLLERLGEDTPVPMEVSRGEPKAIADWLDLPQALYDEHPLANRPHVMSRILKILVAEPPSLDILWDVLEAWDESFANGRKYRVSSAGLEVAAEKWLIDHLPRLRLHGYPVQLVAQQRVLRSGRRIDLLCHFDATSLQPVAGQPGDLLVIELKATRLYPAAVEQLARYVSEVAEHLANGRRVHGLLVTDGADHADVEALRAAGLEHLSLAKLGYRLHLAQEQLGRHEPIRLSLATATPATARTTGTGASAGGSDLEGPESYWVRLFWDNDHGLDQSRQRSVAAALWERRQARRSRYEAEWGSPSAWPAQHPTTVLDAPGTPWGEVAACVSCTWLTRPIDLDDGSPERPSTLHEAAKEHALAHSHDPRLEAGENPTKPEHEGGVAGAIHRGREELRRRANLESVEREDDSDEHQTPDDRE